MERLLHYCWKHKILPLKELLTTTGQRVEVIDTGLQNPNAGPDFFNAKIKLNDVVWVGNIEIHQRASDWFLHEHHKNTNYDSVILHIAEKIDATIYRSNGEPVPQIQLACPDHVRINYKELLETDAYPPCYRIIPSLSPISIRSWIATLQIERYEQRITQLKERLTHCDGNWEDAFFITMARNFGFGLNGDAFETWANRIPLRAVDKHRNNLFQIEALFFGQAGILADNEGDEYYMSLKREYQYLAYKFHLSPMDGKLWKFLRLRPSNFPHVRIAQLACLYHSSYGLMSKLMNAETIENILQILRCGTSVYWLSHYTFGGGSPERPKTLSNNSLYLIIINTVIPFLYAYSRHKGNEKLYHRANTFLETLKPEMNLIIRTWSQCGIAARNAGDSQALIQLKKEYCDKKKCLSCRIGYEYLKRKAFSASENHKNN